jgi:hypothetical protein
MFDATVDNIESDQVTRYCLTCDGRPLTFSDVLDLWQSDADFRDYYTRLLAASPFAAYRWETPALSKSSASQPFQFVLLNCPRFCSRKTDRTTYGSYFTADDTDHGIVSFANLSGDATLIVPSPRTEIDAYGHLAAFIRHAPKPQLDAFWRVVGTCVKSRIGHDPLWLSTAGGGVAWLHVRLDPRPKYYGYSPYKSRLSKP